MIVEDEQSEMTIALLPYYNKASKIENHSAVLG